MNRRVLKIAAALAALVSDEKAESYDDLECRSEMSSGNSNDHSHHEDTHSEMVVNAGRKTRRTAEALELIQSDFTGSITLVIEIEPIRGQFVSKEAIVRSKWDSGSTENAISMRVLRDEGIRGDLIFPIPPDEKVEFTWLHGDFSSTPKFTVTISWFKKSDLRKTTDKFYVVPENAPFDVLMNHEKLAEKS
ncbi:hypothetical protein PG988_007768 [Apiospora saccharicola]